MERGCGHCFNPLRLRSWDCSNIAGGARWLPCAALTCPNRRIIDPELHRWQLRRQMERHTYVTAAQLRQLAAELQAQASGVGPREWGYVQ